MSQPRLVLHVFSTFGKGGPQVRTVQWMAQSGAWASHRVLAMDGCFDALELVPAGIEVERVEPLPRRSFFGNVRQLQRSIEEAGPDLVLTYNWGAIEAVVAARRAGRAVVHHEEGFGAEEWARRLRRRNWIRRLALRNVPVVVPSRNLERIARSEWGLQPDRLRYLPNGVDCDRFRPTTESRDDDAFVIGAVGGLRAEKDHATLLTALASMQHRGAVVELVGDGPERAALAEQAQRLCIADRVGLVGSLPDPAAAYRRFDCFCLPSRTEQMPLSLLEAMASGLPVVGSDVGDVSVMLPESCRGGLVPPGSPERLAAALDAMAKEPARRRREGAANRQRVLECYELRDCLGNYQRHYEQFARG
jgi:glycosyltransferase involved in cell wall biosynthesis